MHTDEDQIRFVIQSDIECDDNITLLSVSFWFKVSSLSVYGWIDGTHLLGLTSVTYYYTVSWHGLQDVTPSK